MSTQFGGGTGGDASEREFGGHDSGSACQAEDLRSLIGRIAEQLSDTDQRQTAALAHMLARVEALGKEARNYKSKVPPEFLPAFERIEDGVSQLADRIAGSHGMRTDVGGAGIWGDHGTPHYNATTSRNPVNPEDAPAASFVQSAPSPAAASQSASDAEPSRTAAPAHAIDPVIANDEAAWDQEAADALVSHYENELGAIAAEPREPTAASFGDSRMDLLAAMNMPQPLGVAARGYDAGRHDVRASLLDSERDWLEEHFVDIARKVEESLAQRSPVAAISGLGERFEQLEQRFGSTLQDVATRSDVEALHALENHIAELSQQFEDTRGQLVRLDSIEHSLAAVIDRLTDPRFDSALERSHAEQPDMELMISAAVDRIAQRLHSAQPAMPDLNGIAHDIAVATAERVASQFADFTPSHGESDGDVETIRQLLEQFIGERREGEEHTAAMLDTMQRALIRVLDRVDALESNNSKAAADYGHFPSEAVSNHPAENPASAQRVSSDPGYAHGGARGNPEQESRSHYQYDEPVAASVASQQPPRLPNSPASIDRLRKDFIADARRAKDKAASTTPEVAAADIRASAPRAQVSDPTSQGVKLGKPKEEVTSDAPQSGGSIVSRLRNPSRKLLVGAIVLMIAIPGVLMLLKKGQSGTPQPTAIERSQAPSDRTIAPVSPARQIENNSTLKSGGATDVLKGGVHDSEPQAITPNGSSSQLPDLPQAQPPSKGSEFAPENTPPKVEQQRGSSLPSGPLAQGSPPSGITVATPRRSPSLEQLERLSSRNTTAQLSNQLGEAQINAVPAALIPEFMYGESNGAKSEAVPAAPKIQASISDSRRQPLDLPPAQVGPLSLRMSAANGNPSAEFAVAARFADGTGVNQNLEEAMRWYQRSASRGFAQSQYRVATLYERGLGVKQDIARAKIWYQRAAESGNVKAMHNLAVLSAGRTAKVPDYNAAAQWFKSASEYGLADSQFNLAVLHESGLGVTQDVQAAYFWFALAARNGDTEALRRQNELERNMKPDELSEAKRKLDNWRPKQADRVANDPLAASEAWKTQAAAEGAI